MPRLKDNWKAYRRGTEAREQGIPFKKNPYKTPAPHTNWALGWMDAPKNNRTVRMIQRSRAKARGGR